MLVTSARIVRFVAQLGGPLVLTLALAAPAEGQAPPAGGAPSKEACGKAYVEAQHERAEHKLIAARKSLTLCAQESCPQAVRPDCAQWLSEVVRDIPSIAVHARDAGGADVADVRVSVDGVMVADRLVGLPVELDPGAHALRFEHPDTAPIEQPIVAVQGERVRSVDVRFGALQVATAATGPAASRPVPLATWVLGGAGVAAGVATAILWASAQSQYSSLKSSCAPRCNPSDASSASAELVAGDVAVGVGAAALVAGAVFFFLRPSEPPPDVAPPASGLDVTVSPRGASLGARLVF